MNWVAVDNIHPETVLTDSITAAESPVYAYLAWTWSNEKSRWVNDGWVVTEEINF